MDRRVPVEAELFLLIPRQRFYRTRLVRFSVHAPDLTTLGFGVQIVLVRRIDEHPEPIASVHVFPAAVGDAARILRIADPGAVVLQTAIDVIWTVVVEAHVIELRDRKILALPPLVAAVVRIPDATIVSGNHTVGAGRIDPDVVKVPVRAVADAAEALTAVRADDERTIGLEDAVFILWIHDEVGEIER